MAETEKKGLSDEDRALGLFMSFNVAYLDGVMKGEHPEIRAKWETVREYTVKLAISAMKGKSVASSESAAWIPVSERKPTDGGKRIIFDGERVRVVDWHPDWWGMKDSKVTHWMSLPEAP